MNYISVHMHQKAYVRSVCSPSFGSANVVVLTTFLATSAVEVELA